jgi:hypothetical protein
MLNEAFYQALKLAILKVSAEPGKVWSIKGPPSTTWLGDQYAGKRSDKMIKSQSSKYGKA